MGRKVFNAIKEYYYYIFLGAFMERDGGCGNITIDESEFNLLKKIDSGYKTIELINKTGKSIDGNVIANYFREVPGINKIKTLRISYSSNLEDLMIIKAFPNLLNINVTGHKIKSLDGLKYFIKGKYLNINTDNNRHRSIDGISLSPISSLTLKYEKEEDFDAISESTTITNIELGSSPQPPFDKWGKVPLTSLKLSRGKLKEFGNTAYAEHLNDLILINCRQLERFIGENSRITWMVIDGCTKLDLTTIHSFSSIENLSIHSNSIETPLSVFGALQNLKSLDLVKCNLKLDILDLKEVIPKLEDLHIMNLKKEQLLLLKRLNPEVNITS